AARRPRSACGRARSPARRSPRRTGRRPPPPSASSPPPSGSPATHPAPRSPAACAAPQLPPSSPRPSRPLLRTPSGNEVWGGCRDGLRLSSRRYRTSYTTSADTNLCQRCGREEDAADSRLYECARQRAGDISNRLAGRNRVDLWVSQTNDPTVDAWFGYEYFYADLIDQPTIGLGFRNTIIVQRNTGQGIFVDDTWSLMHGTTATSVIPMAGTSGYAAHAPAGESLVNYVVSQTGPNLGNYTIQRVNADRSVNQVT